MLVINYFLQIIFFKKFLQIFFLNSLLKYFLFESGSTLNWNYSFFKKIAIICILIGGFPCACTFAWFLSFCSVISFCPHTWWMFFLQDRGDISLPPCCRRELAWWSSISSQNLFLCLSTSRYGLIVMCSGDCSLHCPGFYWKDCFLRLYKSSGDDWICLEACYLTVLCMSC